MEGGDGVLSLPNQVDVILRQLASVNATAGALGELQQLFLAKVSAYGGGSGYAHEEMRTWSAYQAGWQHRFVRIYNMGDDGVQVLRRAD